MIEVGTKVWVQSEGRRFQDNGKHRKPLPYIVSKITRRKRKEGEEWKPNHDHAVILLDDGRYFDESEVRVCRTRDLRQKPRRISRQKRGTLRREPRRNGNGCHVHR